MICSYCGATYRKNAERCPNCQSENPLMIERRKNKVRQSIDKQAMEEAKGLPEKKVKMAHTIVVIVIAGLLSLLVVGGSLGYVWSKYKAKIEYATYQHNVERLEELIAEEQWEDFYNYYYDHECWDSKYEKYEQLVDARRYGIDYIMDGCGDYLATVEHYKNYGTNEYFDWARDDLERVFGYYADLCASNQKNVNDRVILGNEKLLKQWEEEITLYLKEELHMTDAELEIVCGDKESDAYKELVNKYLERDTK